MFLSAWVVISLFPLKSSQLDKLLGDLSYPVYLLHTTAGMCIYFFFGQRSLLFFSAAFALTVILSYGVVRLIEKPLIRFKKQKTIHC